MNRIAGRVVVNEGDVALGVGRRLSAIESVISECRNLGRSLQAAADALQVAVGIVIELIRGNDARVRRALSPVQQVAVVMQKVDLVGRLIAGHGLPVADERKIVVDVVAQLGHDIVCRVRLLRGLH